MTQDPIPPSDPRESVVSPPSRADLFDLSTRTPLSSVPPSSDPRVSLRAGAWPVPVDPLRGPDSTTVAGATSTGDEPQTLSEFREHEGTVARLSRLRSLFDSIPSPPTSPSSSSPSTNPTTLSAPSTATPPASPVASTSALPLIDHELVAPPPIPDAATPQQRREREEDEKKRWEAERKLYMRELWRKCGAEVAASSPPKPPSSPSHTPPPTPSSPTPSRTTSLRWSSFETYADAQERALFSIFQELDKDHDSKLAKADVEEACKRAGVDVSSSVVRDFFRDVDRDGDGMIGWEEWRDFLLLLPRKPSVKEIFHYYRSQRSYRPSMSRLTQDGDVVIGRGKSSFNRFLSASSKASSAASTTPSLGSTLSTPSTLSPASRKRLIEKCSLQRKESGAVECRWARDERDARRKRRDEEERAKRGRGALVDGIDFEESGVVLVVDDDSGADERTREPNAVSSSSMSPAPSQSAPPLSSPSSTPSSSSTDSAVQSAKTTVDETTTAPGGLEEDDVEEEDDEQHGMFAGAGKFLLAGGMAGAVSRTATAPFDRLKVYLITSPSTPIPKPSPAVGPNGKPPKPPRPNAGSLAAAVRAVYSQGGLKAFWTGNLLNVVKIFPESAIKFLSYESAKRVFAQHWDCVPDQTMISNSSRFVSGGIGGVVSQFCIYPIESLKTRVMSSTGGRARGNALILQTFRDMYSKGGFTFFFRGLPAGLIGVFPYAAIDMSTFEGIKISYTKWAGEEPGIVGSLCFGAVSGGVGATSVYPLNLVRTRLQAQGTPAHPQVYTGIKDAAIKCYQREGWRGFYKGLTPTLVKVVPAVAISYAVYDQSKRILFGKEDDHGDASTSSPASADSSEES
ncbi:hypothetical protein JCM10212_002093 [Sporobolomyces blumeae]